MPGLPINDQVKEVKFGSKNTLVQTEQGKIFITIESSEQNAKKTRKVSNVSSTASVSAHNLLSDDDERTNFIMEQNQNNRRNTKGKGRPKEKKGEIKEQKAKKPKGQRRDIGGYGENSKKIHRKDSQKVPEEAQVYPSSPDTKWFDVSKVIENQYLLKRLVPLKVGLSLDYIYILVSKRDNKDQTKEKAKSLLGNASHVINSIQSSHPRFDLNQILFNYNTKWLTWKEARVFEQIDHVKSMKYKKTNAILWDNKTRTVNIKDGYISYS